jgi:diguanylate cyclase (GGDEF)-like protein
MGFRSTGFREETGLSSPTQATVATKLSDAGTANRTERRRYRNHHRPLEFHSVIRRLIIATGEYFMHQRKLSVLVLGLLMVATIGEFDLISGPEISVSLFYILPIAVVTWRIGRAAGFALSVLSVCVWVFVDAKQISSLAAVGYWNPAIHLTFFLIFSATLAEFSLLVEWVRTDYLTGLANARGFHDFVTKEIYRCERTGGSFSLAYLDIDDFKVINDSLGHNAGDDVLRLVGSTLHKTTRKSDIVARIGGDEFTILLSGAGQQSAAAAIGNVEEALRGELSRGKWPVTFTVGIATFRKPPRSVEAAIKQADELMYEAKRMGKNTRTHREIALECEGAQQ